MGLTFVHAGDLRLDGVAPGVTVRHPEVVDALRESSSAAFDQLIRLCIDRQAQFLVLAGAPFADPKHSLRAQVQLCEGVNRLSEHGIWTFIAAGDQALPNIRRDWARWPDKVTVFGPAKVTTVEVASATTPVAVVSGINLRAAVDARTLGRFKPRSDGLFHVGVLGGDSSSDPQVLADLGLDYWALGRGGDRKLVRNEPPIVCAGAVQGNSSEETGDHGCYLVHVDPSAGVETEFCALDQIRWFDTEIDISRLETLAALGEAIETSFARWVARSDDRPAIARVILTGRGPLYADLRRADLRRGDRISELREQVQDAGMKLQPFVWLEKIDNRTSPEIDIGKRREQDDLLGQVLKLTEDLRHGDELSEELKHPLAKLFGDSAARALLDSPNNARLAEILGEAERLCLDLLETHE